jgi:hypothetical protein
MTDAVSAKPIIDYTAKELRQAWIDASKKEKPGIDMIGAELSRRSVDGLTKWLMALTVALVILGIGPEGAAILAFHDEGVGVKDLIAAFSSGPSFTDVAKSYYCVTPNSAPCTIAVIYHSTGGHGTAIATYSVNTHDGAKTCNAVIPSTPQGSDVAAFCVVNELVDEKNPDIKATP